MRTLVIGGTGFLGNAITRESLERGHAVTVLHRGGSPLEVAGATEVLADRDGGMGAVDSSAFDAVIDVCGYVPRVVGQAVDAVAGGPSHYTFISAVAVYADGLGPRVAEDAPVRTIPDPDTEELDDRTYGPLKALCEERVRGAFGDDALIARCGIITGPRDPGDRFAWWATRLARGGRVPVPADDGMPLQVIDARDLAAWIVSSAERRLGGTYNAVGPAEPATLASFLCAANEALGGRAELVPVVADAIAASGVAPWSGMPLWAPAAGAGEEGVRLQRLRERRRTDVSCALASGLALRPLTETARDAAAWASSRPADHAWQGGMSAAQEAALLRTA